MATKKRNRQAARRVTEDDQVTFGSAVDRAGKDKIWLQSGQTKPGEAFCVIQRHIQEFASAGGGDLPRNARQADPADDDTTRGVNCRQDVGHAWLRLDAGEVKQARVGIVNQIRGGQAHGVDAVWQSGELDGLAEACHVV